MGTQSTSGFEAHNRYQLEGDLLHLTADAIYTIQICKFYKMQPLLHLQLGNFMLIECPWTFQSRRCNYCGSAKSLSNCTLKIGRFICIPLAWNSQVEGAARLSNVSLANMNCISGVVGVESGRSPFQWELSHILVQKILSLDYSFKHD